jgi:hypothetical protein
MQANAKCSKRLGWLSASRNSSASTAIPISSSSILTENRAQIVGILFRAEPTAGTAGLSNEVTEVGWFTAEQASRLGLIANHKPLPPTAFGTDRRPYFDLARPVAAP